MRIYTSDNSPLDFCSDCAPLTEDKAFDEYGHLGDGPDGRGNCFGFDADHPSYTDDDGEMYRCHECKSKLTDED